MMSQHDNFDTFLSQQLKANQPYLADEGFTEQVMAALPASEQIKPWWMRPITTVPVLMVSLLILSQVPLLESAIQLWGWLLAADPLTLLKTGAAISAGTLLAGIGWLAREMDLA